MPPFVKVLKEVTEIHTYASSSMAKLDFKLPDEDKNSMLEFLN